MVPRRNIVTSVGTRRVGTSRLVALTTASPDRESPHDALASRSVHRENVVAAREALGAPLEHHGDPPGAARLHAHGNPVLLGPAQTDGPPDAHVRPERPAGRPAVHP